MTWEVICSVLEPFGLSGSQREGFERGTELLLLEEDSDDREGTVYVTSGGELPRRLRHSLIISTGPCSGQADNLICLERGGLSQVFNLLLKTKAWLEQLDRALALCETQQEIIDQTGARMGLPMFYLDERYRVLAITKGMPAKQDQDPEWRHMTEKGFLSPESARRMKENGDLDLLAEARSPVVYRSEIYPFTSIVCNIIRAGGFAGRLNILCVDGITSPLRIRAGEIAAAHLGRVFGRNEKLSEGGPLQGILLDLLRGIHLSEEFIGEQLRAVPELSGALLQVFFVHIEVRNDRQIAPYYAALIRRTFPEERVIPLVFGADLVLVAYADAEEGFNTLTVGLSHFFTTHHLRCGVSNRFRRLSALRGYCDQAEAALAAEPGVGLHFFRGMMLDHMISCIPAEQTEFFISPDLARLAEAENQYSFSLVDTLREYLACNCNLIKTAERMFIHKNTLLYRMNHIRSILQCDLNDADERLLLMLSFKLMERQKNECGH